VGRRKLPPIAPFLKKRLMSRAFDGVDVRFGVAVAATGLILGRAWLTAMLLIPVAWVGGAVKAGPLGPPVGGALRAPRV